MPYFLCFMYLFQPLLPDPHSNMNTTYDHCRLLREKHNDKVSVLNWNKFVPILANHVCVESVSWFCVLSFISLRLHTLKFNNFLSDHTFFFFLMYLLPAICAHLSHWRFIHYVKCIEYSLGSAANVSQHMYLNVNSLDLFSYTTAAPKRDNLQQYECLGVICVDL